MPMTTKPGRIVTYIEKFPPVKSHDLSVTWSCEVRLQIKYVIYPLSEDPQTLN